MSPKLSDCDRYYKLWSHEHNSRYQVHWDVNMAWLRLRLRNYFIQPHIQSQFSHTIWFQYNGPRRPSLRQTYVAGIGATQMRYLYIHVHIIFYIYMYIYIIMIIIHNNICLARVFPLTIKTDSTLMVNVRVSIAQLDLLHLSNIIISLFAHMSWHLKYLW